MKSSSASAGRRGVVITARTACSIFHAVSAGLSSTRRMVVTLGNRFIFFAWRSVVLVIPLPSAFGTSKHGSPLVKYQWPFSWVFTFAFVLIGLLVWWLWLISPARELVVLLLGQCRLLNGRNGRI